MGKKQDAGPASGVGVKELDESFHHAFDDAAIGMALVDLDGRFRKVNRTFCSLVGRPEDALLSLYWGDVTLAGDEVAEGCMEALLVDPGRETSLHFEKQFVHPDNVIVWGLASVSVLAAEDGAPTYLFTQVVDISDRKAAEDRLRERERQLADAQALAHVGSWSWEVGEDVVSWSNELFKIFGIEPRPLKYEDYLGYVHPDDLPEMKTFVENARESGEPWAHDYRIVRADGVVRWVHGRGDVVREAGMAVRMFGTCLEITDRKVIEDELRRLDVTKSEFIANAAHELRTPLTTLAGFVATLSRRRQEMTEAELDEFFATLTRAGERANKLIADLLDLSQIEQGRARFELLAVGLRPCIERSLELAPPPPGVSVEIDVAGDLHVAADPMRMDQVFINLLTNAYRYGGDHVRVGAVAEGERVLVAVTDDGLGVPTELIPELFEPFARAKPAAGSAIGSGLGLAITRRLVEAFGGSVTYEAAPQGAIFHLELRSASIERSP